jgi:hypothetical protein
LKGVVEVISRDETDHVVTLACAEATVKEFWMRLQDNATSDASPPAGVALMPYELHVELPDNGPASEAEEIET